MKQLTRRQQHILDVIRAYLRDQGMPPTRMEIAQMLGFRSTNAVEGHLKALVRKGYIVMPSGRNRNIRLLEAAADPAAKPSISGIWQSMRTTS